MAPLRTYQEMQQNYFPEPEQAAEHLAEMLPMTPAKSKSTTLYGLLQQQYGISLDEGLEKTPGLTSLRSLLLPKKKILRLNSRLSEA